MAKLRLLRGARSGAEADIQEEVIVRPDICEIPRRGEEVRVGDNWQVSRLRPGLRDASREDRLESA